MLIFHSIHCLFKLTASNPVLHFPKIYGLRIQNLQYITFVPDLIKLVLDLLHFIGESLIMCKKNFVWTLHFVVEICLVNSICNAFETNAQCEYTVWTMWIHSMNFQIHQSFEWSRILARIMPFETFHCLLFSSLQHYCVQPKLHHLDSLKHDD